MLTGFTMKMLTSMFVFPLLKNLANKNLPRKKVHKMNKVTKDLMKWFPTLDCNQAFDLHMKLMMEGVDFSEISNKELKSEAARLLGAA
jgi:hypothetical protein